MKIGIGCDHGGVNHKAYITAHLSGLEHQITDYGTEPGVPADYPDIAEKLCAGFLRGEFDCGILICGTGIGMSIAANKHKGIRAALCSDTESAVLTRQHNDANILCLGARIIPFEKAVQITDAFLGAEFLGGRHQRRVDMLESF